MQHNIIFVTHEGRGKKYLCELPEGINVEQGTLLRVRSARGEVIAVAASNSFQADETGLEAIGGGRRGLQGPGPGPGHRTIPADRPHAERCEQVCGGGDTTK